MGCWRAVVIAATVLGVVACTTGDEEEAAVEVPSVVAAEETGDDAADAGHAEEEVAETIAVPAGSREQVQDLWLLEGFSLIGAEDVDLEGALKEWLEGQIDRSVDLPNDATFHVVDAVDAYVTWPGGEARDDVDVIAGLLETPDGRAFAALATPDDGAPTIGLHGRLTFDLTPLEEVSVGDRFSYAVALLQAYPGDDPDAEEGLGGLGLLQHRLEHERLTYFAGTDDDGARGPRYSTGQVGEVIAGSQRGSVHPKADDLTGALEDAVDDCGSPLSCIADWFEGLGDGGSSSFDNALCNGNIASSSCGPPPSSQPEPLCLGPECGQTTSDPYLTPFDGHTFAFQMAGEFVLARSEALEVQVRFEPVPNRPIATLTSALAFTSEGHRVTLTFEDDEVVPRLDGEVVTFGDLEAALEDLGWRASVQGERLVQVRTGTGALLTVVARYDQPFLDLFLDVNEADGTFEGLLGSTSTAGPSGFVTRDGDQLGDRIDRQTRYEEFGPSWRITDEESLFDYAAGESTATFTDTSIPEGGGVDPDELDLDDPDVARARATCEATGITREDTLQQCTFDLWATDVLVFLHSHVLSDRGRQIRDGQREPREFAPWMDADDDTLTALEDDAVLEVTWRDSLRRLRDEYELPEGQRFGIVCPAAEEDDRDRRIWGTDVYWANSSLCLAAVHAGVLGFDGGGPVTVEVVADVPFRDIAPVPRNEVVPDRWHRLASGFEFVP